MTTTTPDPIAWPALILAAWPLWFALLVLLVLGHLDRLVAALARTEAAVRCRGCGAWKLRGRACTTSGRCPS